MKEREISLIDLLGEILLRWRVIIVWMLVGGILMGCLSYVRSWKTAQAQKAQVAEAQQQPDSVKRTEEEALKSGLTNLQIYNVNAVVSYESLWKTGEIYRQESIKMQIDPLNVPSMLLTFQVVAEDLGAAKSIRQVYEDMVPGGLAQWLSEQEQEGTSGAVLSELISLNQDTEESMPREDTFSVIVCHISKEQCLQLAEKVEEYFQEQQSLLERKMGNHQIQLVFQNFSYVMDLELLEDRKVFENNMMTWSVNAARLKDAFLAGEQQYYDYVTENGQEDSGEIVEVLPITIIRPSISVKYVFVGMVLFAFIYVIYVVLKYVLSGRVRVTDDVAAMFGVPELGIIPVDSGKRGLFAFVDDWIWKLRSWNKRRFIMEEAVGLAAVAVKMAAKKESLNEICCIGCNLKTNAVKTAEVMQDVLKNAGISMKTLNNVLYDQETMEQLLSAKGAFLLERAGETFYDEISREIDLLLRQGIKVLGIIVVE